MSAKALRHLHQPVVDLHSYAVPARLVQRLHGGLGAAGHGTEEDLRPHQGAPAGHHRLSRLLTFPPRPRQEVNDCH